MEQLITTKICNKCLAEFPLSNFHKSKRHRLGVKNKCKECDSIYRVAYYAKNREKAIAYSLDWTSKNAESTKEYQARYQRENRSAINENKKQWRADNHERHLQSHRDYEAKNREKIRAWQREYHKQNPHLMQARTAKRRAQLRNAAGSFTPQQWLDKLTFHGYRCYLCKESLKGKTIHLEHRIPISKNGTNWIANIAPACADCNLKKSNLSEKEYKQRFL